MGDSGDTGVMHCLVAGGWGDCLRGCYAGEQSNVTVSSLLLH